MKIKEQNSDGPKHNGNHPMAKRHTSSLRQDRCVIRPLKMAVLLLSIHPLLGQCLLHLHLLTWLTFLYACPRAQLMRALASDHNPPWCLSKVKRDMTLCWFSWWPMAHPDINFPYNRSCPPSPAALPWEQRLPPCPVSTWASNDRMSFQDFLCTCKLALIIKPYVCLSLILGSFLSLTWASNRPGRSGRPPTSLSIQP